MKELFEKRRVFLVGGSGGVGKTTVAASLGVQFAAAGYRTVVLTVDPAKRLAQALGFETFSSEIQKVEIPDFPSAQLFATMLDTQRDFDRVIRRFATNPAQRDKILGSKLYRVMVESLGGSHEYAAMERLLEFANESNFEKIVVDTPPSHNAVDLFSAPQRLADFMDNSVLKWFQKKSPYYLQIFKQGTKIAMKALQKIFGTEFLDQLGEILDDLEGMQAGFRKRNLEVLELVQSPNTAFLLVTYPSEVRFFESTEFLKTLESFKIPLSALILNRIEPYVGEDLPAALSLPAEDATAIRQLLNYYHALYREQREWVETFQANAQHVPVFTVAKQYKPIHEISALLHLGTFLVS